MEQGDQGLTLRRRGAAEPVSLAWAVPAALFLFAFFVLPLLRNAELSILPRGLQGAADFAGYVRLFGDPFYLWALAQTLLLGLFCALVSVLIGYPVALFVVRHSGRFQGLFLFLLIAPLLTSIIMRTFGWRVLFARFGLVNVLLRDAGLISRPIDFFTGPGVAIAAMVHVLVPFMVLSIAASLYGIDRRLEESAQLLGAGRIATFLHVTLPLTMDGIGSGFILVFMLANGTFVTLLLLGGGLQTLPLLIFQQFNATRDFAFATAMSNVLMVAAILCLVVQARLLRRRHAGR